MSVEQEHLLLQLRDYGITAGQLSDDRILTYLHDNQNDVSGLIMRFYDGESGFRRAMAHGLPLSHHDPLDLLPLSRVAAAPINAAALFCVVFLAFACRPGFGSAWFGSA